MIKILFVCLGNICRSPMAEFVFKDMVKKRGLEEEFYIESAATSSEEIGSPVHYRTRMKLQEVGISVDGKYARKLIKEDYEKFDYILGMEDYNITNILRIVDLPAPLGPKITANSPFSIEKLIPLFATTIFSPILYLLYTSFTSMYAI